MISQKEIEDSEGDVATIYGVSPDETSILVRLENNRLVSVPISLLKIKDHNRYTLSQSFHDLQERSNGNQTFPVIEEMPVIEKRKVETASIKIRKKVTESPQVLEESLAKEEFLIDRVPINEVRDEPLQMRTEGDITIIPVQEEVLVVQKKIMVREEIRIRKVRTEHSEKVTVSLRKEEVQIDRKKMN